MCNLFKLLTYLMKKMALKCIVICNRYVSNNCTSIKVVLLYIKKIYFFFAIVPIYVITKPPTIPLFYLYIRSKLKKSNKNKLKLLEHNVVSILQLYIITLLSDFI